jgi:predicted permease
VLAGTPGVRAAGFGRVVPLGFGGSRMTVIVPGYQPAADEDMELNYNTVSTDYAQAVGLELLAGRWFDVRDAGGRVSAVVVNETMARRYWPGGAVGQRVRFDDAGPDVDVIGVVRDVKYRMLREERAPSFYVPLGQSRAASGVLHVRTAGDPAAFLETLGRTLQQLDPAVPVISARTLQQQAAINVSDERLAMLIGVALGGAALLLAAIGLYAALSYAVEQRTREIGVRVALGASASAISRLVVGQSLVLAAAGAVIGAVLATWLARLIESRLYGVAASDVLTLVVAAVILGTVAAMASYVPARRAARIDPVEALRAE